MRFGERLDWMLRLPPMGRFRHRCRPKHPEDGRFMRNRQKPYEGWSERQTGVYTMKHNKHVRVPDESASP